MRLTAFDRNPSHAFEYAERHREPAAPEPPLTATKPSGPSIRAVGRAHGIPASRMYGRLREHPDWTPEQAATWVPLRNNGYNLERFGMSLAEYARQHGVGPTVLRKRLHRHPDWTDAELIAGRASTTPPKPSARLGETVEAFAERHGLKPGTVHGRLRACPDWTPEQIAHGGPRKPLAGATKPTSRSNKPTRHGYWLSVAREHGISDVTYNYRVYGCRWAKPKAAMHPLIPVGERNAHKQSEGRPRSLGQMR